VRTPTIDTLAADGVLFERHFTNAVPCGPSRACMHTGMYLHNHRSGTNGTPLDARFTNWALEVRRVGYDPVLFGYTHTAPDPRYLEPDDPRLGTDEGVLPGITPIVDMATHCGPWRDWLLARGYPIPDDHGATYGQRREVAGAPNVPRPSLYDSAHTDTFFLVQSAIDYIETVNGDDAPGWCVHLSLRAPHPPWIAAAPYHARYAIGSLPGCVRHDSAEREGSLHPWLDTFLHRGRNQSHADDRRHRLLQASYYGLMAEVDDNLARLFACVRDLGAWDDTLVIFTSDHGEQMGDHWLYGKAGFFDQSYAIPLVIRRPDGARAGRVGVFTEHVDLMPTLLDWLGIEVPRQCDGHSLMPFLVGGAAPRNWRDAAHWEFDFRDPDVEGHLGLTQEHCLLNVIRDRNGKYVHFAKLPPLFFDLEQDPSELTDRVGSAAHRERVNDYATRLLSWRMQHADKTLTHFRVTREAGLTTRQ